MKRCKTNNTVPSTCKSDDFLYGTAEFSFPGVSAWGVFVAPFKVLWFSKVFFGSKKSQVGLQKTTLVWYPAGSAFEEHSRCHGLHADASLLAELPGRGGETLPNPRLSCLSCLLPACLSWLLSLRKAQNRRDALKVPQILGKVERKQP